MSLTLLKVDPVSGLPTCRTTSDGTIDVGGLTSGQFGIKCLPVLRTATGTDTTVRVTAATSYSVPINTGTSKMFSGTGAGFTLDPSGTGAVVVPYTGVYRIRADALVGADLPASGYDHNSVYQFQVRTSSSLVYLSMDIDMTNVLPDSGTSASADKFRGEETFVLLNAGVMLRGLLKLATGAGGHYHAASVIDVHYLGPGV